MSVNCILLMVAGSNWEILHIPDKPPSSENFLPTVNVFASVIQPKLANTLVRRLSQIAPMENLRHVKRVKKDYLEGGKLQLSLILCVACENENQLESIPNDVLQIINTYQLSAFITKVSKYAALTKEEWEEQCKLWPTSYHPPTYSIDGIAGFSEVDKQFVFDFMHYAIELAKSHDCWLVNAAVIVDPAAQQIIASACDQICSSHVTSNSNNNHTGLESSNPADKRLLSVGLQGQPPTGSYKNISCCSPWRWIERKQACSESEKSSSYLHPLKHAAIVAIDNSASRDRCLYPNLGQIEKLSSNPPDSVQSSSVSSHSKRRRTNDIIVEEDENQDAHTSSLCLASARPYLCTGYDIYLVCEPCTMCAMALVHQRIRRIFYALPNPSTGALGSTYRLQGEKSLNHHYAVFRVVLPDHIIG